MPRVYQAARRPRPEPVRSVADFERLAGRAKGEVLLRIYRQGTALFVALSPLEG